MCMFICMRVHVTWCVFLIEDHNPVCALHVTMPSGANALIQDRLNSQLVAISHGLSTLINIFQNTRHAVTNVYHHENYLVQKQNTNITSFDREVQIFKFNQFVDLFVDCMIVLETNPATLTTSPDTVTCFVEKAGYQMIEYMQLNYVNNEVTSKFPYPRYAFTQDRLTKDNEYLMESRKDGMLVDVNSAYRNAALLNGHKFYIPVHIGLSRHTLQNSQWISNLSHALELHVGLAQSSDIIYAPNGTGTGVGQTGNITNLSSLIKSIQLYKNGVTVDDVARKQILNKSNGPSGILNKVHMVKQFYIDVDADAPPSGELKWTINGLNVPARMITFFVEAYDENVTPWQKRPMHCSSAPIYSTGYSGKPVLPLTATTGGVLAPGATQDYLVFPTHVKIETSGSTIFEKREIELHRRFNEMYEHTDRAFDWYIDLSHSVKEPMAENKINGSYDYGVYSQIDVIFTWPTFVFGRYTEANPAATPSPIPQSFVVEGPGTKKCRIYALFHTDNYIHSIKGDASKLLNI